MAAKRLIDRDAPPGTEHDMEVYGFTLPGDLAHLAAEIEQSRSMLSLPDDWDEEGSPGYAEATWHRAVALLVQNATRLWRQDRVSVQAPRVRKGPEGSIDLDWRAPDRELLINVPADPAEPATYYGDDGAGGHRIKGALDTSADNRWLLRWLTE